MKNVLEWLENKTEQEKKKIAFIDPKDEISFGELEQKAKCIGHIFRICVMLEVLLVSIWKRILMRYVGCLVPSMEVVCIRSWIQDSQKAGCIKSYLYYSQH